MNEQEIVAKIKKLELLLADDLDRITNGMMDPKVVDRAYKLTELIKYLDEKSWGNVSPGQKWELNKK